MKSLLVFAAAAVFVVSALPVIEQDPDMPYAIYEEVPLEELLRQRRSLPEAEFEEIPFEEVDHGMRAKRATCDLLSFSSKWVTVNHSACALHCLTKGYKGGKCKNTICNCRN